MLEKLSQLWKARDIRKDIIFVLLMLIIFRIAAHIPIPGIRAENLRQFFEANQFLGLLNIFTGGGLANLSIIMLGVGPYITASIIFQLLTMVIPKLEAIAKEGEVGQRKINQWTRLLTVPLAVLQSYGMIMFLEKSSGASRPLLGTISSFQLLTAIITITAGTIFLMWIGELISEKKVGNGISLIIFAGIVTDLPRTAQQFLATFDRSQLINLIVFVVIALVTIAAVVYITEAQRNIPVSYARRVRGRRIYGGLETHLPIRVNQAGMIPIIFAISIILFPPLVAQFLLRVGHLWVTKSSQFIIDLFQNQAFYGLIYFFLVVGFTYFYTAVIFHPQQIAENLQKQGGFVPGLRPGRETASYLNHVVTRIILAGALFLGCVAVLPVILQQVSGINLVIGGASLLIVVSVVIETVKQIDSQLVMRDYEGL